MGIHPYNMWGTFMMQIEDLIKKNTLEDLQNGILKCNEQIKFSGEEKGIGINYWRWKYYSGLISRDEHEECKKNTNLCNELEPLIKIYEHIFGEKEDVLQWVKDSNLLDELSQLWMMRPREKFEYEEKFSELIYQVYVEAKIESDCNIDRFRQIALNYHEEKKCQSDNNDLFLICNNTSSEEKYNEKYGIFEMTVESNSGDGTVTSNQSEEKKLQIGFQKKFRR